ncbi:hypothetical protein GF342_01325 [Candidatus Woesearchaeota archaeon]|nr:hypothetical protein [Candidatus Woesearchaeota archaeon]
MLTVLYGKNPAFTAKKQLWNERGEEFEARTEVGLRQLAGILEGAGLLFFTALKYQTFYFKREFTYQKRMALVVRFENWHFFILGVLFTTFAGMLIVSSYGTSDPAIVGHSAGELEAGILQGDWGFNGDVNVTGTVYAHNYSGNSDITFVNSAGNAVMTIQEDGDVGIGTTPTAKFHVAGGVRTSSIYFNPVFIYQQTYIGSAGPSCSSLCQGSGGDCLMAFPYSGGATQISCGDATGNLVCLCVQVA